MTRINEAEWLIEPFYECQARGLNWRMSSDCEARVVKNWQAASISWEHAAAGSTVARLERTFHLPLYDADRLCIRLSHAGSHRVTMVAVIDGEAQTVVDRAEGANQFAEFEGAVSGDRLDSITIEIEDAVGGDGHVNLLWIIAVDHGARERYRRLQPTFDPAWPGLLRAEEPALSPVLELSSVGSDLDALRRRVASPAYRAAWTQIRAEADALLDTRPEEGVRAHVLRPGANSLGRYAHDLGTIPSPNQAISGAAMQSAGLVGLVEQDTRYARLALRHALAAAHCEHWDDSFMMTRPGAVWDHRAFTAMSVTEAFLQAVDWAGALLTPVGFDLVARVLSSKVLPKVDFSLRKYAYMRENNQAIFFATTGVLATCALGRILDHGGEGLAWYVDVLRESVENYILEDGGSYEGVGYHDASCARALAGFTAAARFRGVPVAEVVPPILLKAGTYYRVMASTAVAGAAITTSDGGRVGKRVSAGTVPTLARLTGDPALRRLTVALCTPDEDGEVPGARELVVNGPELPGDATAADSSAAGDVASVVPVFAIMDRLGMLASRRDTPDGPVRVQLVGAKANAGHSHEDKGSIILEAFGEELLVDRGTCFYGDARSELLKFSWRHNLLTPNDSDGHPLHQVNPVPTAVIPSGDGDERRLHATIDVSAAWPHALSHCARTVRSDEPRRLLVVDTATRTERASVSVHFHSRFPWEKSGNCWTSRGRRGAVTIEPRWRAVGAEAVEDLFDSAYQPVYRLSLQTTDAIHFELETEISVSPCLG